ncbi:MAG: V-type ATPase subunit [archaeon]
MRSGRPRPGWSGNTKSLTTSIHERERPMDYVTLTVIGVTTLGAAVAIAPSIKVSLDLAPYMYTNTRCSAKLGLILKPKTYNEIIAASTEREQMAILEDTYYGPIMEKADSPERISELMEKDLYDTYLWLKDVVPKNMRALIGVLVKRFEIADIKRILNAIRKGEDTPEPRYVGSEELRTMLLSVKDEQSLMGAFEGTEYQKIFSETDLKAVAIINSKLDLHYIASVRDFLAKEGQKEEVMAFKEYWKNTIDLANARLLLRAIASRKKDMDFISGGSLDATSLASVGDKNQFETLMNDSDYASAITSTEDSDVEMAFFRHLNTMGRQIAAKYSLKSGPVVRFIIQKELEIRNLNVLFKLKREGFDKDEISRFIIIDENKV